VAVDVAVLSVVPAEWTSATRPSDESPEAGTAGPLRLAVVLLRRDAEPHAGQWGLPGSFVHERERLADSVRRTLASKCAITGLSPTQLHVFDDPERDDRGWVLSVAHLAVVPSHRLAPVAKAGAEHLCFAAVHAPPSSGPDEVARVDAPATVSVAIPGRQRRLPFDHDEIVTRAVTELRRRYEDRPDPDGLMGERFTLLQLRRLHEAIHGQELQKDTFRRQMIDHLVDLHETSDGTVGRPAALFAVGR
jgi:ADP-ribose pyrophosphatase YjhB (NUDIX family)